MNDFRFAVRQLCKSPGFTLLAIVTLALGIGVNSAIFALVNGVVLRPMIPLRANEVVGIFTARQTPATITVNSHIPNIVICARMAAIYLPILPRLSSASPESAAITRCGGVLPF